ncbi:MAG: hypothetical protein M3383_08910 [Actinomycetota bacterium]|nr:hypothetical protein [Actinomycetota bacterium]
MRLWLAALLCATVWVGCGGDDSEDHSKPVVADPITKVEFLREADEICFASEAQIEAAADDILAGNGKADPAEVKRIARGIVVPALEAEVAAIGALRFPAGDEAKIRAILAATEAGVAQIEADPAGLLDGVPQPLREAQRLAAAYGSRQCGIRG